MHRDYERLNNIVKDRLTADEERERRMQIVVDVLWDHLQDKNVSWVGFYLKVPGADEMVLGPRCDKPACSPIGMHGACGQSFLKNEPMVVRHVKELGDAYITCDPRDQSEVVIPIHDEAGLPVGVLDLDSFEAASFDQQDVVGLVRILATAELHTSN